MDLGQELNCGFVSVYWNHFYWTQVLFFHLQTPILIFLDTSPKLKCWKIHSNIMPLMIQLYWAVWSIAVALSSNCLLLFCIDLKQSQPRAHRTMHAIDHPLLTSSVCTSSDREIFRWAQNCEWWMKLYVKGEEILKASINNTVITSTISTRSTDSSGRAYCISLLDDVCINVKIDTPRRFGCER